MLVSNVEEPVIALSFYVVILSGVAVILSGVEG
jgi:hypothetical protein